MSDDRDVIQGAVRLIEKAREVVPYYGAGTYGSGWSGTDTKSMSSLLASCDVVLRERRFRSGAKGMAFEFGGRRVIAVDTSCKRSDATFTIRHELAHILADEVEHALYLTSEDTMSYSERRADLFALADLTPTSWIRWIRKGPRPWRAITLDVVLAYRQLTEGWTEARLWDRARLRVALYRQHGI